MHIVLILKRMKEKRYTLPKDFDWNKMSNRGGPANEEEAIARIEAIEADYERTDISYSLEEVIAESHKRHQWIG